MAILAVVVTALIVVADQLTKLYAINAVKPQGTITVIENFYYFTYVENRGAAFGMLQNQRYVFIIITLLIFAVFIYVLIKYKIEGKLFLTAMVLLFGGGIGNLIDSSRFIHPCATLPTTALPWARRCLSFLCFSAKRI